MTSKEQEDQEQFEKLIEALAKENEKDFFVVNSANNVQISIDDWVLMLSKDKKWWII